MEEGPTKLVLVNSIYQCCPTRCQQADFKRPAQIDKYLQLCKKDETWLSIRQYEHKIRFPTTR